MFVYSVWVKCMKWNEFNNFTELNEVHPTPDVLVVYNAITKYWFSVCKNIAALSASSLCNYTTRTLTHNSSWKSLNHQSHKMDLRRPKHWSKRSQIWWKVNRLISDISSELICSGVHADANQLRLRKAGERSTGWLLSCCAKYIPDDIWGKIWVKKKWPESDWCGLWINGARWMWVRE